MMTSNLEDESSESDLVRWAAAGDEEAWAALVDLHRRAVFRLAFLHLGDVDDAEDVAQQTFIRAHRALRRFDHARPMRPWLLRIATNQAYNWRRSAGRYWGAIQRFARQAVPSESGTEQLVEGNWQNEMLREAVQQLPTLDRDVIYLRFFLDLPVNDVAATLGIAPGTVKSRSHRALGRLRAIVEEKHPSFSRERLGVDDWGP